MDRDEALALLDGHVHKESLRNHCLATAAIMRAVAPVMGGDPDQWEIIGILHMTSILRRLKRTWTGTGRLGTPS